MGYSVATGQPFESTSPPGGELPFTTLDAPGQKVVTAFGKSLPRLSAILYHTRARQSCKYRKIDHGRRAPPSTVGLVHAVPIFGIFTEVGKSIALNGIC